MPVLTKINTNSIAEDAITGDKFAGDTYLSNTATQNITGTYSESRLYTSDAYTLSANATVNSNLTLSTVKSTGDVVLTASGAYTITGTGELSGGSIVASQPQRTDLTGMTGALGSAVTGGSGLRPDLPYAHFWNSAAGGQNAGTFTAGIWQTRVLNNSNISMTGCSLSSNQITLPAGTYWCTAQAPSRDVDTNKARLYNVTGKYMIINGTTALCADANSGYSESWLIGVFVLDRSCVIEVQHQCVTTKATFGLGGSTTYLDEQGLSVNEVWTQAAFLKIG